MTPTYYTPTLDEFHYGFEFEVYNTLSKYFLLGEEEGWRKVTVDYGVLGYIGNIHKLILDEQIRVPFLNHNDIVECGWGHDYNLDGEEYPFMRDKHGDSKGYFIDKQSTDLKTIWIMYHFPDGTAFIERAVDCGAGKYDVLFVGTIKNKSQLKLIMKMINID